MKRFTALLTIIICLCITASAFAEVGKGSTQLVLTWSALSNQGGSALSRFRSQFSIGGSPYRGGIALRYFTSDKLAIRPWFWIGYDGPTMSMEGADDATGTDTEWGLGFYLEKYLMPFQSAAPYVGFGFVYNSGSLKYEGPGLYLMQEGDLNMEWKSSEIRITGTGGFNWFPSTWVGVGAEVEVGYIRFSVEEKMSPEAPMVEYKGNTFGFIGATMFLSVGFGK
jgi:hypothetical protein